MSCVHRDREMQGGCTKVFCAFAVCTLIIFVAAPQAAASEEPGDSAIGIVIDILKGDEQEMHAVAIAMVKEMPGEEITKALAAELPNLPSPSQVQLISAFAERGDSAALPAVVAATKFENESARIAALKALEKLGDASIVMVLAQRAAASSGAEQKAARESLYRLRGSTVNQTIMAGIAEAEPEVKIELIRSIGKRNIYAGVETLLKTARDSDRKVGLESFRTLESVAGEKDMPALIELLLNVQGESERKAAEKTITVVARKIDDSGRRTEMILAVLPSVKDVKSRCSLLNVLGKIGQDNSLTVLKAALGDENPEVRDTAVRVLSEWPDSAPIDELLKIARDCDNKVHRILALRGFVRLIGVDGGRPAEETVSMYKQAMSLAPDASLKRRVLAGLADVKSFTALEAAAKYLEDETLKQEAEFAVVKIAGATGGKEHPEQTKAALQKVIEATKNDSLREEALKVLKTLDESKAEAGD